MTKSGELSSTRQLQLDWWTAFRDALLTSKVVAYGQTPRPQYWYDVALGRSGMFLSNSANANDGRIGVRVYLSERQGGNHALEQLLTRISDMAVVPYRQDQAPRLDFWGSDIRNHTTEGDTLWVNYTTSHFSSRSTVS